MCTGSCVYINLYINMCTNMYMYMYIIQIHIHVHVQYTCAIVFRTKFEKKQSINSLKSTVLCVQLRAVRIFMWLGVDNASESPNSY